MRMDSQKNLSELAAAINSIPMQKRDRGVYRKPKVTPFYVYVYHKRGKPFYVGKGIGNRVIIHFSKDKWVSLEPYDVRFFFFEEEKDALRWEKKLIIKWRLKYNLLNERC